jgi:uncharacterized membrane protein
LNRQGQERELNDTIGAILRYGVALSSAVIVVGLILTVVAPPQGAPATLQGALVANYGRPALSVPALIAEVRGGNPVGVLELGTLILLATPVTRVAASVVLFLEERDGLYVAVTLLVLSMLLLALFVVGPAEA